MGLLRLIFRSPLLIIKAIYLVLVWLLALITKIISPFVGQINWQPPTWFALVGRGFQVLDNWISSHVKGLAITTLVLAMAGWGGFYAYHWKLNQPKPVVIAPVEDVTYSVKVYSPAPTNYNQQVIKPGNLVVSFTGSVAPLELVNKEVTQGITLSPSVPGKWRWEAESRLVFVPEQDWPVGQTYTIDLDANILLAPHSRLNETKLTFSTSEFNYRIVSAEFYQNPQNPLEKNAIYQVKFTHPVDVVSFEKALALYMDTPDFSGSKNSTKNKFNFSVKYDEKKLDAWVRSESVKLPSEQSSMTLNIGRGVLSSLGGKPSIKPIFTSVSVPGYSRNLVNNIFVTLAQADNQLQQQVLMMTLDDSVKVNEVSKLVKAWILPANRPKTEFDEEIENYNWSSNDDINDSILAQSKALKLTVNDSDSELGSAIGFKFKAEPGQYIYVKVGQDFSSEGGYKQNQSTIRVLQVPEYPQMLRFMSEGAILSMKGERKLPVVSQNVKGMKLDIKRVIPEQLHHLISFSSRYEYSQMAFTRLSDEYFTEHFVYEKVLPEKSPGELTYEGIDISDYLINDGERRQGVFLVKLSRWLPKTDENDECDGEECEVYEDEYGYDNENYDDYRLIVVTDLGIIAKRAIDGTDDVFIQSIQDGTPVEGAKVSVLGKNGVAIVSAITDANGHVRFDNLSTFKKEKSATTYIVEKDGDLSFLPVFALNYERQINFSRFDVGGIENPLDPGQLTGFIFSDRGVYRPGDSTNLGIIVRAADWGVSVDGLPLELEVYDPRDQLFTKTHLEMDKSGFAEFTFTTAENSPTGTWPIYLYVAGSEHKDRIFIGSTVVDVKEFEPDRMKVAINLTPELKQGWAKPGQVKALVKVENLFGTPAQDRRVETVMKLRPMNFYFSQYADYDFYDSNSNSERFEMELEPAKTDADGIANISLLLEETKDASYQLFLLTEAFEAGSGRSVAATAQILVSPHDFLVGAKPDGSLNYIPKGTIRNLELIAINPDLQKVAVSDLKVEIYENKYLSVLTLQDSGVYKYQSKLKEQLVSEAPLVIDANGTNFALPNNEPGDYVFVIRNKSNEMLYRTTFSVAGNANVTRSLERNAELKMRLSKAEYAPGEEIEISISAPYIGSGLITLERDKVYHWQWFKMDTTSSVQKIKIPEDFIGNGYVNVQFVRDPHSDDVFMSPLSYGVQPFKVKLDAKRASIELKTEPVVKPGSNLAINVTTNSAQRVVVYAVDEGILQVARYRLMDPLNHFYRKRQLGVESIQILDLILPEFSKLMALTYAAGGDGSEELDMHLNPFKRKRDKPVVYWSGIVDVDGSKTLNYLVPDYFNGKLRVMAVSVTPERIGTAQTYATVRDEFVLNPNVPYTVAPGDEFEVTLGVANNLENLNGSEVSIRVDLTTTPHVQVIGEASQSLSLAEKREGMVRFKLRATESLGGAELKFAATYQNKGQPSTTNRVASTSVRPATPYRTITEMGRMASTKQEVANMRDMFNPYAKRDASVAHSPLILGRGLAAYLSDYPHYCSEQLVSRAIPLMVAKRYPNILDKNAKLSEDDPLASLSAVLRSRQNSQGAIGLWRATASGDRFVSLYTVHYLVEMKERGEAVPADLLDKANKYLQKFAADNSITDQYGLRLRSYAVYLLTRQGQVTTNLLSSVQERLQGRFGDEWKDDMTTALYLASSYKLLKMDKQADMLLSKPWSTLTKAYDNAWWSHDYYDPLVQNSTAIYLISAHFPEKVKDIPAQALENMVLMLRANRYTTTSSGMSILAIDTYSDALQKAAAQQVNGGESLTIEAMNEKQRLISQANGIIVKGQFEAGDKQVFFINQSSVPAWYSVIQSGYDKLPPKESISRGLEITREYTDEQGNPVDSVVLGQKVNVVIKVRSNSKEGVGNVAIIDLFPGGFEVVQQTPPPPAQGEQDGGWVSPVSMGESTWKPDYTDIREDRVIIYGTAHRNVSTFIYQIKATNIGRYLVPSVQGEAMYDREIQAVSPANGYITVKPVN